MRPSIIVMFCLLLLVAQAIAFAQSGLSMKMRVDPPPPKPAYAGHAVKTQTDIQISDPEERVSITIPRRDQIAPELVSSTWHFVDGGYQYEYVIRNAKHAQQPIKADDGVIAPGKEGKITILSDLPPGPTALRLAAPINTMTELTRRYPSDVDDDFRAFVTRQMAANCVELHVIGPAWPNAVSPAPEREK